MGGKVIFKRPCVFHEGLSIQNKQGGMKMTLLPMATHVYGERRHHGAVSPRTSAVDTPRGAAAAQ
jgi:hypothetical protein